MGRSNSIRIAMNCTDSLIIMVLSLSAKSTQQAFKSQYVISQLVRKIQAGVKTFWRQEDTCCLNVWPWRQSLYHISYYAYTHHILFVTSLPYNFSHPALKENCALAGTKKKSLRWRKFDFHDIKIPTRCKMRLHDAIQRFTRFGHGPQSSGSLTSRPCSFSWKLVRRDRAVD